MTTIATHDTAPIRTMQIAGDSTEFLGLVCKHSESLRENDVLPQDFTLYEPNQFCLDPGGMMCMNEPLVRIRSRWYCIYITSKQILLHTKQPD